MRKLIALVVALIVMAAIAVPAIADSKIKNIRSGEASPSVKISNSGSYVNLCTPIQQIANTGNVINQQSVDQQDQYAEGDGGDVDFEGSSINIDGSLDASCDQSIVL